MSDEKENRSLVLFIVPELDSPEADKFLKSFRKRTFIDVRKHYLDREVVVRGQKMIIPCIKYLVLVYGDSKDAEGLVDLLIKQNSWYPKGENWGACYDLPMEEWDKDSTSEE